jgi:hypothetical protein
VDVRLLAKLRRVAELWTEGDNALAHIHLAHARLPPCVEEQALRLRATDAILERKSRPPSRRGLGAGSAPGAGFIVRAT